MITTQKQIAKKHRTANQHNANPSCISTKRKNFEGIILGGYLL